MEGAMPKANLWSKSVPADRARPAARVAQFRLERIERLLMPRAAMTFVFLASAHTAKLGKVIEAEGR
jgi:hypothetical protein